MSVTLESALEPREIDEPFGLNLQLEPSPEQHSGYRTVFGKPEKRKKASRASQSVSDITLVKLATVSIFEGIWNLFLYLNLWYVCYPTLLFASLFMSQILLKPDLAILTPIHLVSALIAGCAGMYYAYYMFATFVFEKSDPAMYADERPYFLLRISMYGLIMWAALYGSSLLNISTIASYDNQRLFISFYLLYLVATTYLKYFSHKLTYR